MLGQFGSLLMMLQGTLPDAGPRTGGGAGRLDPPVPDEQGLELLQVISRGVARLLPEGSD